jgi:hypothetical protein
MFDGPDFPKSLDEELFNSWLEEGRLSMLSYQYLLIIWNELERDYQAVYVEQRDSLQEYERYPGTYGHESLIAAYDLYSESRVV